MQLSVKGIVSDSKNIFFMTYIKRYYQTNKQTNKQTKNKQTNKRKTKRKTKRNKNKNKNKKTKPKKKIQWILILRLQDIHDYVHWHCSIATVLNCQK